LLRSGEVALRSASTKKWPNASPEQAGRKMYGEALALRVLHEGKPEGLPYLLLTKIFFRRY